MTNSMNWMPSEGNMDDIIVSLPLTITRRILLDACLNYFDGPDGDPTEGTNKAIRTYYILAYRLNLPYPR